MEILGVTSHVNLYRVMIGHAYNLNSFGIISYIRIHIIFGITVDAIEFSFSVHNVGYSHVFCLILVGPFDWWRRGRFDCTPSRKRSGDALQRLKVKSNETMLIQELELRKQQKVEAKEKQQQKQDEQIQKQQK